MDNIDILRTRCVLAALFWRDCPTERGEMALEELASLVDTAGGEVLGIITQNRPTPESATCLGEGKIEELRQFVEANEVELIVFENELSPSQIRNIEKLTGANVFDRSMLILEIFNLHAISGEGKLQVEMAQLKYTLPRLTGKGIELSRLGGGGGMGARRGQGETKLEIERRRARERIASLREELALLKRRRSEQRKTRGNSNIPNVAIVGYTNAGKSTLLNSLTGANVLAENKLFATLDATTRKLTLKDGFEMLFTDTVGFIQNLPHHLIEAFSSTLEEASYADIILLVTDASDPDFTEKLAVVERQLNDIGAMKIPRVVALNKIDLCEGVVVPRLADSVEISAKTGAGFSEMLEILQQKLSELQRTIEITIPYSKGNLVEMLHRDAVVLEKDYREDGIFAKVQGVEAVLGKIISELEK